MFMHLSPKERFGYVALGAILLVGGGFIAAQKLRRPAAIELHQTPQPPVVFDHGPSAKTPRQATQPTAENSEPILVHVAGAVARPGLVRLLPGSRVFDAIREAGGPTEDANVDGINLAAKAIDGTQILVPRQGVAPVPPVIGTGGTAPTSRGTKAPAGMIDINAADASQFQTLPGIGPTTAQRIIEYRTEHGRFQSPDDLRAIKGFGQKRLDKIRQWLTAN